ncbi:MAG TPA: serine hydrolase [Pyrinomonadaceae bacterium]|nr:serine hydrolase [Pyrinomonadaceae bacterium]
MVLSDLHSKNRANRISLLRIFFAVTLFIPPAIACQATHPELQGDNRITYEKRIERFEKQVEELRRLLKIPGMSAVVVKDQKVLWADGFGFADLDKQIPATPDTLYHVASLTKTFAATLILQLVEQGKLDLNEPMSRYSEDFKDDSVKIKHLLSHTSEGTPGDRYRYSGDRYAALTAVIEKKTGKSFREVIVQTFLEPLQMSGSVPSHDVADDAKKWTPLLGKERLDRYSTNLIQLAQPYSLYGDEVIQVPYPPRDVSASAGLLSTVVDMARYDAAIDRHLFLKPETQAQAWTPFMSNSGQPLPHGLGWFVENYKGQKLIWHYGHWGTGFSATYLKVPDQKLSLILLANSEALSDPFYRDGGIETNAIACSFLRIFVFDLLQKRALSDPAWGRSDDEFSKDLARMSKEASGYGYDCERVSHAAIVKWLTGRKARVRKVIKQNPEIYDAYVGEYELNPNRIFVVSREGDRLFIDVPRGSKTEMFPESKSKFFLKAPDAQIEFVMDKNGQVTALEIRAYGQTLTPKRIKRN